MKYLCSVIFAFFLCTIAIHDINAQEEHEPTPKDVLVKLVNDYYTINIKIFKANSTIKDIDEVFELFTDDFVYIHPKYGGTYTRQELYDGYVRNQKKGGYDGSVIDIKVINMITGLDAIVTEKKFINKTDTGTKEGDAQMALFEFKSGKISKIFEYW
ncbi:nuclear transport factor 2 family protein [Aquimarina sp. AU119]|uniref:nuclear transport factor 2 family protein n=1 Tax=Aquimarina sp. AU119 TaxID=2108528 RepID=UPI000D692819|nr:nuclear transport factor 2 family protein [Aquimarina sp. AU119]